MSKALTVQEVAERLAIKERTVYGLIERKELKAFKVGRLWRIRDEELRNYIEREEEKAEGEITYDPESFSDIKDRVAEKKDND